MAKRLHKNQKERISTDMYLKSILEYELDNGKKSKPIEIVKSLNLTKGSVSEMIKKLEEENYIKYESYGEINLTEKGLKRAKNVKKKYVVIKKFLDEVLNNLDLVGFVLATLGVYVATRK